MKKPAKIEYNDPSAILSQCCLYIYFIFGSLSFFGIVFCVFFLPTSEWGYLKKILLS